MPGPAHSTTPAVDYSLKWWVMISVAMGTFLSTIDSSIVNVSLPTLEEELNTNFQTVQWVVVSYLLVLTSLMLGVGRLADMTGKKRIYLTGMVVFTTASVLCGMAPSIGFLIGFRAVQGFGAVMMQALGFALVTEAFPPKERGRALGMMGTVVSVGISLGPTVGGLLIGTVGWRAIFLVNVPVGIMGLILVRRFVPDWRPPGGQRFDFAGAGITFFTLLVLALGLTLGPETGWSDPLILGLLGGAVMGVILFLIVESRLEQPMIDLNYFRDPLFSIGLLTGLMVFVVIAGMFVLPFYLELVKGYDPKQVGLFLTVVPVALGLTAPVAGALSDRYGSRGISVLGLVVVLIGCFSVASLKEDTSTMGYILRLLPVGLGAGLFQSPNNSAIMGTASRDRLSVVSGLLSLSRTLGQSIGVPLLGAIFASRVLTSASMPTSAEVTDAPGWAIVQGIQTTFLAGSGLIIVGVVLAVVAFRLSWQHRAKTPARRPNVV